MDEGRKESMKPVEKEKKKKKEETAKKAKAKRKGRVGGNSEHGFCIFVVTTTNSSQSFQSWSSNLVQANE